MRDWEPDLSGEEDDPLRAAVFQALGAASMCWEQTPTSVFDSTRAAWVGDGLMRWIQDAEARAHPMIVLDMAEEIYTREDAEEAESPSYGYTLEHGAQGIVEEPRTLEQDLAAVLNKHSAENVSDTPDFILAGALVAVLNTVDWAILRRGTWYGHHCSINGGCSHE